MILRITLLWIFGLLTIVPYATYQLFFVAEAEQYAFLITLVLFWIFGFWGVVGPLVSAYKIHHLFKTFENITSTEKLEQLIHSQEVEEVAIDLIASENRIPRFLAKRIYNRFMGKNS